jgi:hypothetical protein
MGGRDDQAMALIPPTNGTSTLFKSVALWGAGSCGTNQCAVEIQTNGAYYGFLLTSFRSLQLRTA